MDNQEEYAKFSKYFDISKQEREKEKTKQKEENFKKKEKNIFYKECAFCEKEIVENDSKFVQCGKCRNNFHLDCLIEEYSPSSIEWFCEMCDEDFIFDE